MKSYIISAIIAALMSFIVVAEYSSSGGGVSKEKLSVIEEKLSDLEARLYANSGKDELRDLQISILKDEENTVYLSPATKDYGVSKNDNGNLFFSMHEVKKYADGHKVILHIGNPNAVTYTDVNLNIVYGKKFEEGQNYQEWRDSLRETSYKIKGDLTPATWSPFEIVLSPSTDEETGYVEVTPELSTVIMTMMPLR